MTLWLHSTVCQQRSLNLAFLVTCKSQYFYTITRSIGHPPVKCVISGPPHPPKEKIGSGKGVVGPVSL